MALIQNGMERKIHANAITSETTSLEFQNDIEREKSIEREGKN
jgi:hypothetical protein